MKRPLDHISMKHLMAVSVGTLVLGVFWIVVAWMAAPDQIWIMPGMLLVIAGIVKVVTVQIWVKVVKLGTDEHDPIKAL
jgi:hypothetical protein